MRWSLEPYFIQPGRIKKRIKTSTEAVWRTNRAGPFNLNEIQIYLFILTKELKWKVLSEKKFSSDFTLRQVASILNVSKMESHKSKIKHWDTEDDKVVDWQREKQFSTDRDDHQFLLMSLNNRRMTSRDLQKEWQTAAGVAGRGRMETGFFRWWWSLAALE